MFHSNEFKPPIEKLIYFQLALDLDQEFASALSLRNATSHSNVNAYRMTSNQSLFSNFSRRTSQILPDIENIENKGIEN
jgi:hypothetical protein